MKKLRQSTVEPVLGTLINFMGLRRIWTRGMQSAIILELAHLNDLQPELFDWIETSVRFLSHPKD